MEDSDHKKHIKNSNMKLTRKPGCMQQNSKTLENKAFEQFQSSLSFCNGLSDNSCSCVLFGLLRGTRHNFQFWNFPILWGAARKNDLSHIPVPPRKKLQDFPSPLHIKLRCRRISTLGESGANVVLSLLNC
eukprot:5724077-Amphidinium_carterae.1